MKVTQEDVKQIAKLAHLEFDPDELSLLTMQLDSILAHFEKLKELRTEGIEPTFRISALRTPGRKDEIRSSMSEDESLQNAPEKEGSYFKVPKVIR